MLARLRKHYKRKKVRRASEIDNKIDPRIARNHAATGTGSTHSDPRRSSLEIPDEQIYMNQARVLNTFWTKTVAQMEKQDAKKFDAMCQWFTQEFSKRIEAGRMEGKVFLHKFLESLRSTKLLQRVSHSHPQFASVRATAAALGRAHTAMGVKKEHYPVVLDVFHKTMSKFFKKQYTPRVRYCCANLFNMLANFMTESDFVSVAANVLLKMNMNEEKIDEMPFEHVWEHPHCAPLLTLFMHEKFCSELLEFVLELEKLKACASDKEFKAMKAQIFDTFLKREAAAEVNVSSVSVALFEKLTFDSADNQFKLNLIYDECITQIKMAVWIPLKCELKRVAKEAGIATNSDVK